MGKFDLADKFFRRLYNELPTHQRVLITVLEMCTKRSENIDKQSMRIKRLWIDFDGIMVMMIHALLSLLYFHASVGFRQKHFNRAVSFYQIALMIGENCLPSLHPDLALALDKDEQGDSAFEHCEKALNIGLKTFSSNDIRLSVIYAHMGEFDRLFYQSCCNHQPVTLGITKKIPR